MTTWRSLQAFDKSRPWLLDLVLALALLGASMVSAAVTTGLTGQHALLLVLAAAPYPWRRVAPVLVLVAAAAAVVVLIAADYGTVVIGSGLFLLAYTVAAHRGDGPTVVAAVFCLALLVGIGLAFPAQLSPGEAATNLALFAGAFAVGRAARSQRTSAQLVAERAALAERAQAEEARTALAEERLRIARELHDVVGHSLAVIALQAAVGARVADSDPAEARAALEAIAGRSRTSLQEVRQIVTAMRDQAEPGHPVPGLADLPGLVTDVAAAGLAVEVEQLGEPWPLSPAIDATAYRVLQESLTNVVNHAHTDRAWVTISYTPEALELRVRDRGRGPADGGPGSGQLGMRERIATWGGSLEAGPAPDGGYQVVARLPRPQEEP